MSYTIETGKEAGLVQLNVTPRPLILCTIVSTDLDTVYLSTVATTYGGNTYLPRISSQLIDAIQSQSSQGYDIPGSISLTITDPDFFLWTNHANAHGWRGGTLVVQFLLRDIPGATFSTNFYQWTFILGKPNIDGKGTITVEAQSKTSMTRLKVPNVPRQNRCPWVYPQTLTQKTAALNDPTSIYYQCGHSFGVSGGIGNDDGGTPCNYTRQDCTRLGMFSTDWGGGAGFRFGGDTWNAPVQFNGRSYLSGQKVYGFNSPNPATGATYYPQVWGKQWVNCLVLEPAGNPDSLRAEVIVCIATDGPVNVQMLLVNGVTVPYGNTDVLFTWRYITQGGRDGKISQDAIYDGTGDPHGSMCCVEFVVPSQLVSNGIPSVQALVTGPPTLLMYPISSAVGSGGGIVITFPGVNALCAGNPPFKVGISGNPFVADGFYQLSNWTYGPPGTITLTATGTGTGAGGYVYFYVTNTNPVWHLMDLLTWGPFFITDFDPVSWYNAAAICDQPISYIDATGATQSHPRYESSFALEGDKRQVLAQAVLALRNNAGILLGKDPATGLLTCFLEQTLADQQPNAIPGSNYNTPVASLHADGSAGTGCLAYLFDGAGSITSGTFKLGGQTINDTPNGGSIPFQDSANQYQRDSIRIIDPNGYTSSGDQEIDVPFPILGIKTFDQGIRRLNVQLAKALYGNTRFDAGGSELPQFSTTVKAAHLASRVGYICGLNYEQMGL